MRFELVSAKDGLEASILFFDFDPALFRTGFPDPLALRLALEKHGCIAQCLDDSALHRVHAILARVSKDGSQELLDEAASITIARGTAAQPEEVDGLVFHKPYLSDPGEIEDLKSKQFNEGWDSVENGIHSAYLVEKGAKILEYLTFQPGRLGSGIRGEAIPLSAAEKSLPEAGTSIFPQPQRWMALKKGLLVLEDNTLKILGPKGPDSEVLWIAPDNMSVRLLLRKSGCEDEILTLELLKAAIAKKGFAFFVPDTKLNHALREFLQEGKDQDLLLLQGKPCTPGSHGSQELLVDPEPIVPDPEQAGKVDFKNFTFFKTVRKGDLLARIHPPVEGEMGMDVFGTPILPPPAIPFEKPAGRNTERKGTEVQSVFAGKDGRLALEKGVPEVIDTLEVNDDISLKTGNISFPGSVEIKGDLRDNMEIKADGDVDIAGTVEDGCITSDGAIVVRGGFTGSGKGVIKSKLSSVTIGHIRNQRIESHSNIIVYNEVINALLYAKKSIIMKILEHSVVGGHLKAYSSIEVSNVGNQGGVKTILEVGKDFEVEQELGEKQALWASTSADLEFLETVLMKIHAQVKTNPAVTPEIRLLEKRTKGILQFVRSSKESLATDIRILEARLYNPGDCFVHVRGNTYPGTILKYQDRIHIVSELAKGKRWLFRGQASGASKGSGIQNESQVGKSR
ncbi:MAG: FapA family protein [Fibrobacterota bacterium]|nr:FapA family protein [Fibrobacterota bacterium]